MRFVFFGTPRFAEIILDGLIVAEMAPTALVCNPDRPVGRKKTITPPATKTRAIQSDGADIDILQPETFDEAFIKRLTAIEPDFFVVAAYAKIIPQVILDIPRLGTLGVHPSLLPYYRGASPIQSVILAGEHTTGVSIYGIDEKMDHGPVYRVESRPFDPENISYLELEEELAHISAGMLIDLIPSFAAGKAKAQPQDEAQATFTKKFTTQDGFIDEKELKSAENGDSEKARKLLYKINALNPEPGTWTIKDEKRIKLLAAELIDGSLHITSLQQEGGTPKNA